MVGQLSFVKNKVARRILLSFLLAAILSICILGVISFQQVSDQIRSDTTESLQKNTKDYALRLLERLILTENYLKLIAPSIDVTNKNINELDNNLVQKLRDQFNDLALLSANGEMTSLMKQKNPVLDISQQDLNNLGSGKTAVLSIIGKNTPFNQMWIAIPLEEQHPEHGTLLGEMNPETLWESEFLGLDDLWVFDATGQLLFVSNPQIQLPKDIKNQITQGVSGQFGWQADDTAQLGFYWRLPINNVFAGTDMVIVHARPKALAFSSIDLFTRIYPLVICVAILIVALLSTRLINKYLTPLENLTTATVKIAEGDLNYRVKIASHDEFETLGDSFNDMTERLRKQFDIQAMMAEIDGNILSSLNADTIIDTALNRLPDILNCELMAIIRFDVDKHCSRHIRVKRGKQAVETLATTLHLSASAFTKLALSQYKIITRDNKSAEKYFTALGLSGDWQLLLIPIQQGDTIAAVLCFGYQSEVTIPAETISAADNFGDRLAVALSNAAWEKKLYSQAHYDAITGLPNRLVLHDNLNQELARARRDDSQVAVIFIDLDHFKKVNDSLGYAAGDELLAKVAEIFVNSVGETDSVFRIGGDEFAVVMSGLKADHQILSAVSLNAEAILAALKKQLISATTPLLSAPA
ncbi:MAG: diguanylate cyclase [Gammaproteobacteria bacterium]|nr:diguanylate cyclase [Gammaproteobacteria bacterium]